METLFFLIGMYLLRGHPNTTCEQIPILYSLLGGLYRQVGLYA